MAILILTSTSGSPGVTTLAVGLALVWPRSVLLADCDPGAHQAVLAGYLAGQSPNGKGLLRVAEAHRDGRPLREVVVDQAIPLTDDTTERRLFLPGFTKPGSANLFNCPYQINRRSNGGGGRNQGFEFQVSRPIWAGFGAIASYTYSDAKANDGSPIPQNSKHSASLTGYYENDLVSARLSYTYRSKFFIDIDRNAPLNQKALESLDASLSFNLTENVALTADAVNLMNEKIVQFSGNSVRPRAIYDNGRQFYVGARVRF